jgi:hypothetical protein
MKTIYHLLFLAFLAAPRLEAQNFWWDFEATTFPVFYQEDEERSVFGEYQKWMESVRTRTYYRIDRRGDTLLVRRIATENHTGLDSTWNRTVRRHWQLLVRGDSITFLFEQPASKTGHFFEWTSTDWGGVESLFPLKPGADTAQAARLPAIRFLPKRPAPKKSDVIPIIELGRAGFAVRALPDHAGTRRLLLESVNDLDPPQPYSSFYWQLDAQTGQVQYLVYRAEGRNPWSLTKERPEIFRQLQAKALPEEIVKELGKE